MVPAAIPVTTPVPPIVATPGVLLLHVPLPGGSFNGVVNPIHRLVAPPIAPGNGLTVTTADIRQLVGKV